MKNKFKINVYGLIGVLLLAGIASGILFYFSYIKSMREAHPILKALQNESPDNMLGLASVEKLLIFYNEPPHPLSRSATQKVRKEMLHALRNHNDPAYRKALLWTISKLTIGSKHSRFYFEEEDWFIIQEALEEVNNELRDKTNLWFIDSDQNGRKTLQPPRFVRFGN